MSTKLGPIYDRRDYAGFIRRTLALILDFVLLLLLFFWLILVWSLLAPAGWQTDQAHRGIGAGCVAVFWLYIIGFRLTTKGTLGYRLMGIRYVYMLAEKPSALAILYRAFLAVVFLFCFLLDHIWILCDERKQAWHDKMSGFFVVKSKAQPIGTKRMVQRVAHFMGLTLFVWEPTDDLPAQPDHSLEPVGVGGGVPDDSRS